MLLFLVVGAFFRYYYYSVGDLSLLFHAVDGCSCLIIALDSS